MRAVLVEEVLARAGSGWMGSSSSEMFARLCMLSRDFRQFSVYIILFRRRMTFPQALASPQICFVPSRSFHICSPDPMKELVIVLHSI